jgi:hypothetical protein
MLSTFLTSGNLIDFLGHTGVSKVNNSISYLDASIKFDKKGTTIEEFIQNVTRMQQKHRSSGLKLTSSGDKIFDKQTKTINLKLGFNTVQKILQSDNFDLILSAVLEFSSIDIKEKEEHQKISEIIEKIRAIINNNQDGTLNKLLQESFSGLLKYCIPEIIIYDDINIKDNSHTGLIDYFDFQFNEPSFDYKTSGFCYCKICSGNKTKYCFINMSDEKLDNTEFDITDIHYNKYRDVLKNRITYFENLSLDKIEENKLNLSGGHVEDKLNMLYYLELTLYAEKKIAEVQVDFEHYKKEYFFRQYRKYCM